MPRVASATRVHATVDEAVTGTPVTALGRHHAYLLLAPAVAPANRPQGNTP
jgi:hypothetical protein